MDLVSVPNEQIKHTEVSMNQLILNIEKQQDVRQSLSSLRNMIKDEDQKEDFYSVMTLRPELFLSLLSSEDAKTRKNTALLIGDMGELFATSQIPSDKELCKTFVDKLYNAYETEKTLFVKSSYLHALKEYNYTSLLPRLKEILGTLSSMELDEGNRKHVAEEIHVLTDMIVAKEGIKKHKFIGFHEENDYIFLTNRLHKDLVEGQIAALTDTPFKPFPAGVRLVTKQLDKLLPLRTYQELLFLVPGMATLPSDAVDAAAKVGDSIFLEFLNKRHDQPGPFYFRIEVKSKMPLDKKSQFIRRFASELERVSNRQLINSATNYELELRLIPNKTGTFNTLVKLFTIKDDRFSYRKEFQASSIKPVNAALFVALAKPYMVENARVLDPFCGVGTLLIERQKEVKADTSYGLDISEEAIQKAKINTEEAGQLIHYINRDFQSFTHEYHFDEIFTDMPFAMGNSSQEDILRIYKDFFAHAKTLLSKTGTIICYSRNPEYCKRFTKEYGYRVVKEFVISEKEDTRLFVIK